MKFINLGQSAILFVDLNDRWFNMTNVGFDYHGGLVWNSGTFNAHISDIFIDVDMASFGFLLKTSCNFPNAITKGEIIIENIQAIQ